MCVSIAKRCWCCWLRYPTPLHRETKHQPGLGEPLCHWDAQAQQRRDPGLGIAPLELWLFQQLKTEGVWGEHSKQEHGQVL